MPEPEMAGLMTGFFPFHTSTIEDSLDRLLGRFSGDRNAPLTPGQTAGRVMAALTVSAAVLAVESAARGRWARAKGGQRAKRIGIVYFPGLPSCGAKYRDD
ncbi:hypothetical protein V5E97_24075 [Singulisphaera sp. Ch08]|uniref:Uncharacterized protein n=1 Tax=Singulisphaera sp. Ch08 TaxID=3120278 RepID=A0AAU7C8E9_9BACT